MRDPRQRAGPGRRAREPLKEARGHERRCAVSERERDARDGEEDEAEDDGGLGPEPRGGEPARNAAEKRTCSERADEDARTGLREAERSAYSGTSGVSAVKSRASTKMIDADKDEQSAHASEDTSTTRRCRPTFGAPGDDMRAKEMHRAGCALVRPSD